MEPVLQIVTQLGVAAVLGWYLYYTTAATFPKISEEKLIRLDAMVDRQNTAITKVCSDFTSCLREERHQHIEELAMLRDDLRAAKGISDTKQVESK